MYIWRRKNRRDRRANAHLGTRLWQPRFPASKQLLDDLSLREQREQDYVSLRLENGRQLMYEYLKTSSGAEEIERVAEELRRLREGKPRKAPVREAVHEVFRNFDADRSGAIDRCVLLPETTKSNARIETLVRRRGRGRLRSRVRVCLCVGCGMRVGETETS